MSQNFSNRDKEKKHSIITIYSFWNLFILKNSYINYLKLIIFLLTEILIYNFIYYKLTNDLF